MNPRVASISLFAVSLSRVLIVLPTISPYYYLSYSCTAFHKNCAVLFGQKEEETVIDPTVGTFAQLKQETVNRGLNLLCSAKYSLFTFPYTSIH